MITDKNPIKTPLPPINTTKPVSKEKVSFFKLIGDFTGYLFNRQKDVSSLSKDIVALEVERARTRTEELLSLKDQEEALKKAKQQALANEYKNIVSEHDARLKHLEQGPIKPGFNVAPATDIFKPAVRTETSPVPTAVNTNVGAPLVGAQASTPPKPFVPLTPIPVKPMPVPPAPAHMVEPLAKPLPVAPAENQTDKKQQDLKNKKHKAAKSLFDERLKHTKQILKTKIENRVWSPYRLAQVNLIKEQRTMFFNWQHKILSMTFFVLLTCFVCVLAWGYLLILEKEKQESNSYIFSNLDNINKQIDNTKKEMDTVIMPFNDKLMYTGYMLDNHVYWTNFFQFLEAETLADVYYSSGIDATINGNVQGSNGLFELQSVAKDYNTISNQTKVLTASLSGKVLAVNISDADSLAKATSTPDQAGLLPTNLGEAVKFKLKLNLDQRIFLRDK